MSVGLQQAWSGGRLDGLGALTASDARGLRATPRSPRGCIQKLAYKVDGFMVSNLVRLKPRNLKEPPALLEDLRDFTKSADFQRYVGEPADLFPAPGRIKIRKRWLAPYRIGFSEWSWNSAHPIVFRDVEEEYRSHLENQTALLRLLKLRVNGSPMAILVNGFSSGHHLMERVAWPMREFHRRGIGVALFALPFHGPRGHAFPPEWPQQNTAFTIEGFRQAIWDLRIAIRAMREAGASHVGVVGMSLGGYTAALLATVTSDIDFMLPYVPIASIPDVMYENDLVPGTGSARQALFEGYREQLMPITPVHRQPLVAPERIRVISGEFDRLATVQHGARLSAHFGTSQITYPGGHLIQHKRSRAFRTALDQLEDAGVLPK